MCLIPLHFIFIFWQFDLLIHFSSFWFEAKSSWHRWLSLLHCLKIIRSCKCFMHVIWEVSLNYSVTWKFCCIWNITLCHPASKTPLRISDKKPSQPIFLIKKIMSNILYLLLSFNSFSDFLIYITAKWVKFLNFYM